MKKYIKKLFAFLIVSGAIHIFINGIKINLTNYVALNQMSNSNLYLYVNQIVKGIDVFKVIFIIAIALLIFKKDIKKFINN